MHASSARKLNPLTSIRFFAATTVVLTHALADLSAKRDPNSFGWENLVSLYFVLSGFILTYVYSASVKFDHGRFLLARVARLWPAHITSIVLIWLLVPGIINPNFSFMKLAATVAMVHAWVPSPDYWLSFVPAAWSISTEFGFYLCFPFLIHNWPRTWWWKLAGSFVLLGLVIVLMQAERAHLIQWMGQPWHYWLYVHPLSRLFEFTLGMATFELWRRFAPKIKHGLIGATVWEFLALIFLIFTMSQAQAWSALIMKSEFIYRELFGLWFMAGSSCFACAALIFVLALEQGYLARVLSFSFSVLLGELSYSIYLIHQAVLFFYSAHQKDFASIPLWIRSSMICLIILTMAYLIWALIERPCRHFLVRLWPTPSNAMAVELPASMITPEGIPIKPSRAEIVLPSKQGVLIASLILFVLLMSVVLIFHLVPSSP